MKRTASGGYKFTKPGRRHLMTNKSVKNKRQKRNAGLLDAAHAQRIKKALPYG